MTTSDLYFQSNEQGRRIPLEEILASTDLDWLENLEQEIKERLGDIRAKLEDAKKRAAAYGELLPPEEFKRIDFVRRALGTIHQRVLRHTAQLRRQLRDGSPTAGVPPVSTFFFTAARNMLPPADYQRLVLVAEQRRSVAMQEALRKASKT